MRTHRQMT